MPLQKHISAPLVHLRAIVSECPTFQTLSAQADAAATLPFVHYFGVEDQKHGGDTSQDAKPYPRALVATEDYDSTESGDQTWDTTILLSLLLEAETPTAEATKSLGDRYLWWLTTVESVIDEIKDIVAPKTRLLITGVSNSIAPQRRDPERTQGQERWIAAFVLEANT